MNEKKMTEQNEQYAYLKEPKFLQDLVKDLEEDVGRIKRKWYVQEEIAARERRRQYSAPYDPRDTYAILARQGDSRAAGHPNFNRELGIARERWEQALNYHWSQNRW